jgi:hypothetical protein
VSAAGVRPARRRFAAARVGALGREALAPGPMLALVLVGAWALVYPHTPDLAAQEYRRYLFAHFGWQLWDGNWYGGHHLPGYSLLVGPLTGALGLRLTGALAVAGSLLAFRALAGRAFGAGAPLAVGLFAVAAAGDLWIGRVTFALGLALALAAALALARGRTAIAGALGAACAAASPVTGLFLVLAGAAYALPTRRPARGAALAAPALLVVVALALLFPEGGREPFPATSVAAALAAALAVAVLVGRGQPLLRAGAWLYVAAVGASALAHTPMGSNVARLGVAFGAPLLGGVALREHTGGSLSPRRALALAVAVAGLLTWTVWGPVREVAKVAGDPSTQAAYWRPLEGFLAVHLGPAGRVEVPFTRAHWEADYLAQRFPLARGWERQLDTRYDGLFFSGHLTARAYRAWLRALAVRYVALPDVPLDGSSRAEAELVRARLPFLREVWRSVHWRVYEVGAALAAGRGAGVVTALGHGGFDALAFRPGVVDVQVRWSRYLTVVAGRGCVARAPGGFTRLVAARPGPIVVVPRFSLARALGGAGACRVGRVP